jgi:cytochrome c553
MNNKLVPIFALAGLVLAASPIQAESLVSGSADAGKAKALTCTACHGPEGNSSSPLWPNIAGQNAPYIQAQLMAFKDGSRKDPLMSSQAMLLSAEDRSPMRALLPVAKPSTGVATRKAVPPLAWLVTVRPGAAIPRPNIRR